MKRLYLKRYLPIVRKKTCVEIGVKDEYLRLPLEALEDQAWLDYLIDEGITLEECKSSVVYTLLRDNNMLTEDIDISRKEMFFQYCKIPVKANIYDKTILILGIGAIGSNTAYLLAQFGFKNLHFVDYDIVEDSDIEKMMVYRSNYIGLKKVVALKSIIEENFPYCNCSYTSLKITDSGHIQSVIDNNKPDLVVKAMDPANTAFRLWLNKACVVRRIPFVVNAYSFEYLRLGPFLNPPQTCCDNCINIWFTENYGEERGFDNSLKLYHDYTIHPAIAFNITTASGLAAKEIIYFFLEQYDKMFTYSSVVDFKAIDLVHEQVKFSKHPGCEVCSSLNN